MAKFLIKASYTADGTKGLLKDGGSGRRKAVDKMVGGMGGKVECFYYAFGETDVYSVIDVPDSLAAAAMSFAISSTGAVRLTMTPLLTVEEVDAACKKSVNYKAPGK
jgi:uncharacterized protein with GYD domain